jgi:2-oxoglutarate dehydrogenase E2 component (dihydrolipoamide succinyltransferase)
MSVEIIIPNVGESITSGVVSTWRKKSGEFVALDDVVLDLETDKITMEVRAPASGVLTANVKEGETVNIGAVVGTIEQSTAPANGTAKPAASAPAEAKSAPKAESKSSGSSAASPVPPASDVRATPLAKKVAEERGVDLAKVPATGPGQRVRESDVVSFSQGKPASSAPGKSSTSAAPSGGRNSSRERMSPLRQRVASRLVEAQHTAAMLTTFNEVDMSAVMALRSQYKEAFEKKHGIGLGFMSFFVKAVVQALRAYPLVNAFIVDDHGQPAIEKHDFCDIAVAVASPKGLVVPVIRNAESLSMAAIEQSVKDLATKAKDGKLTLEEMTGGTFTITNGGIFGSLMSTPILNPPQSAILGMHAIKNRAVENPQKPGEVAIRPMMYLALSYDHRMVDGAEAVRFLVKIKECIEDPQRLLLGL